MNQIIIISSDEDSDYVKEKLDEVFKDIYKENKIFITAITKIPDNVSDSFREKFNSMNKYFYVVSIHINSYIVEDINILSTYLNKEK